MRNWQETNAAHPLHCMLQGDFTVSSQGSTGIKKDSFHWEAVPARRWNGNSGGKHGLLLASEELEAYASHCQHPTTCSRDSRKKCREEQCSQGLGLQQPSVPLIWKGQCKQTNNLIFQEDEMKAAQRKKTEKKLNIYLVLWPLGIV